MLGYSKSDLMYLDTQNWLRTLVLDTRIHTYTHNIPINASEFTLVSLLS